MTRLVLALFIHATILTLRFSFSNHRDGHFIEYKKDKMLREKYGEDAFSTTPYSLTVSDGVGGCEFSSKYISNTIVNAAAQFYLDHAENGSGPVTAKEIREWLLEKLAEDMHKFNVFFAFEYLRASLLYSIDEKLRNQLFSILPTSATLISGYIYEDKTSGQQKLHIFQKGDSLLAIFRKTPSVHPNYYSYTLYAVTPEHQSGFNTPYQFSSYNHFGNFFQDINFEIDIQPDDIVVAGSDGLFDNVFVGYLTYMINLILYEQIYMKPNEAIAKDLGTNLSELERKVKDFDILGRLTKQYFDKLAEKHNYVTIKKASRFKKYKTVLQEAEAKRQKQENDRLAQAQIEENQRVQFGRDHGWTLEKLDKEKPPQSSYGKALRLFRKTFNKLSIDKFGLLVGDANFTFAKNVKESNILEKALQNCLELIGNNGDYSELCSVIFQKAITEYQTQMEDEDKLTRETKLENSHIFEKEEDFNEDEPSLNGIDQEIDERQSIEAFVEKLMNLEVEIDENELKSFEIPEGYKMVVLNDSKLPQSHQAEFEEEGNFDYLDEPPFAQGTFTTRDTFKVLKKNPSEISSPYVNSKDPFVESQQPIEPKKYKNILDSNSSQFMNIKGTPFMMFEDYHDNVKQLQKLRAELEKNLESLALLMKYPHFQPFNLEKEVAVQSSEAGKSSKKPQTDEEKIMAEMSIFEKSHSIFEILANELVCELEGRQFKAEFWKTMNEYISSTFLFQEQDIRNAYNSIESKGFGKRIAETVNQMIDYQNNNSNLDGTESFVIPSPFYWRYEIYKKDQDLAKFLPTIMKNIFGKKDDITVIVGFIQEDEGEELFEQRSKAILGQSQQLASSISQRATTRGSQRLSSPKEVSNALATAQHNLASELFENMPFFVQKFWSTYWKKISVSSNQADQQKIAQSIQKWEATYHNFSEFIQKVKNQHLFEIV